MLKNKKNLLGIVVMSAFIIAICALAFTSSSIVLNEEISIASADTVYSRTYEVSNDAELETALAVDNSKIVLRADINTAGIKTSNKSHYLDLNNHTLSSNAATVLKITGGNWVIDSSVSLGQIKNVYASDSYEDLRVEGGTVRINNVNCSGQNKKINILGSSNVTIGTMQSFGQVNVDGTAQLTADTLACERLSVSPNAKANINSLDTRIVTGTGKININELNRATDVFAGSGSVITINSVENSTFDVTATSNKNYDPAQLSIMNAAGVRNVSLSYKATLLMSSCSVSGTVSIDGSQDDLNAQFISTTFTGKNFTAKNANMVKFVGNTTFDAKFDIEDVNSVYISGATFTSNATISFINTNVYLDDVTINQRLIVNKTTNVTMYGGTIKGVAVRGAGIPGKATSPNSFTMYDGTITSDKDGVIVGIGGKFYMYGGKIVCTKPTRVYGRDAYEQIHRASVRGTIYINDDTPVVRDFYDSYLADADNYNDSKFGLKIYSDHAYRITGGDYQSAYWGANPDVKIYGGTVQGGIIVSTSSSTNSYQNQGVTDTMNHIKSVVNGLVDVTKSSSVKLGSTTISTNNSLYTEDSKKKDSAIYCFDDYLSLSGGTYYTEYYGITEKTLVAKYTGKTYLPDNVNISISNSQATVKEGDIVSFYTSYALDPSLEASRLGSLYYQWYYSYNGAAYTKATGEIGSTFMIKTTTAGKLNAYCEITGILGSKITKSNTSGSVVSINPKEPVITKYSDDVNVAKGAKVSLSVTATSPYKIEYNWYRVSILVGEDKTAEEIASNNDYYLSNGSSTINVDTSSFTNGYYYVCKVRSEYQTGGYSQYSDYVFSGKIAVETKSASKPQDIYLQSYEKTTKVGSNVILNCLYSGVLPSDVTRTYQWYMKQNEQWVAVKDSSKDGEIFEGTSTSSFKYTPKASGEYSFKCYVTDTIGLSSATTKTAMAIVTVTQNDPAKITSVSKDVIITETTGNETLSIAADNNGYGLMTYQWQKTSDASKKKYALEDSDFTNVVGATNPSISLSKSTPIDCYYRCVVTNTYEEKAQQTVSSAIHYCVTAADKIAGLDIFDMCVYIWDNDTSSYSLMEANQDGKYVVGLYDSFKVEYGYRFVLIDNASYEDNEVYFASAYLYNSTFKNINAKLNGYKPSTATITEEPNEAEYPIAHTGTVSTEVSCSYLVAGEYDYIGVFTGYYKKSPSYDQSITKSGESDSDLKVTIVVEPSIGDVSDVVLNATRGNDVNIQLMQLDAYGSDSISLSESLILYGSETVMSNLTNLIYGAQVRKENGGTYNPQITTDAYSYIKDLYLYARVAGSDEFVKVAELLNYGIGNDTLVWDTKDITEEQLGICDAYVVANCLMPLYVDDDSTSWTYGLITREYQLESNIFTINFVEPCHHNNVVTYHMDWGNEKYRENGSEGYVLQRCADCGETIGVDSLFALETVEALDATCDADGHLAYKKCPYCETYYAATTDTSHLDTIEIIDLEDVIVKAAHKHDVHHEALQETCEANGNIDYYTCSYVGCDCCFIKQDDQFIMVDPSSVTILKHHNFDAAWTIKDDVHYHDCIDEGNHTSALADADKEGYGTHVYDQQVAIEAYEKTAPTCESYGVYYLSCICGKSSQGTSSETTFVGTKYAPHDLEFVEGKDATCTEEGVVEHFHCKVCEKNYEDEDCTEELDVVVIQMLAHNYQWVVDKAATTQETGLKHEECAACHAKRNENTVIDKVACAHNNKAKTNAKAATCLDQGKEAYYYCSDCNKYYSDEACQLVINDINAYGIIPALGHSKASTWSYDESNHFKACTRCGEHLDVHAHEMQNNACDICGYVKGNLPSYIVYKNAEGVDVYSLTINAQAIAAGINATDLFNAAKGANGIVEIKVDNSSITFDKNAVSAIGGQTVTFKFQVSLENLAEGQELVIEVSLDGATFANGIATISTAFTKAVPDGKVAKLYFVKDGTKEDMNATFEGGKVTFTTNHFSTFAVYFESVQTSSPKGGLTGGAIAGIVIGVLAGVALIGVGVFFFLKKKKAPAPTFTQEEKKEEPIEETEVPQEEVKEDAIEESKEEPQEEEKSEE